VTSVAQDLERLPSGDLPFRLSKPFSAEYEKLQSDFNAAMHKLQQTMKAIAFNTEGARSCAGEITHGRRWRCCYRCSTRNRCRNVRWHR
jgi:methyl-accepting chemotaxis protein